MRIDELQTRLLAVARRNQPSDRVPYHFEKRILARLKESSGIDAWAYWGRMLWRATAPCAMIMIALSVWTIYSVRASGPELNLEETVLAPVHLAAE